MRPELVTDILKRGTVQAADGTYRPLHGNLGRVHLENLATVAARVAPRLVLEIGMAFGMSSLVLAQALADAGAGGRLICIDPYQTESWGGIGRLNVERTGLPVALEVREEASYLALPRLLADGVQADLVFIDGNHTRDYVRVDAFYAHRLVRRGGVVAFDDTPNRWIHATCEERLRDYHYEEVTPAFEGLRGLRHRVAAAIGMPRRPRVRYFRQLDDHEPPL